VLRKTETSDLTFESDVKGTVQLSGLEAATYDVTIQVESHATLKTNLVVVEDMQNPQWILSRGQSIRAQVLKDGEPQPDVAVMLSKVSEWGYDNEYFDGGSHEEKSDAEGYVTFETLADGKYRCKVRSNDVGIADSKVIVLDDSKNNPVVELHLKEGLSIKGIVVDTEGNPIADQDLNIYAQMTGGEHQNGSSGDDGRFVFQNLKENLNYQLNLNSDAWELTQSGQLHVKAGDQEVKVEVRPMSVLQVHVVDPNGERIDSGATFYMTQEISEQSTKIHNVEWIGKAWEISKRQLNLNVWNMNSRVAIEVHVDGFNPAKSDFMETSKLFDAIMKLELTPQQSVTFRVMNALGLPVEGVELLTQGGMRAKLSAQSNAEGVAVLKGVVAGDLDLTFSKSGYARERAVFSVDPSVPHETEVVLSKGGILMGQVFDRNGDPAVGAKVWITRDDGVQVAEQHTTEGGHYKFTHIKEGEVQLHFSIDSKERFGLPTEGATVEIVNEQETLHDCHEKEIEKAGQLVIVIDEQLSNAYKMVMVTDALGQNMQRQQVTETTIRFEALPEGVVTVVLFGTGGMRNLSAEIKEGEETILEISDDDALKKTAKIVHQDDSPVSMGVAYLLDVNFNATNPMDGMKAMNGMSMIRLGDLEITAQRTGTYRLVVQLHEGESAGQQKDLGEVVIVEGGDPFLGTFKIPEGLEMKLKVLDENGVPLKKVRAMVVKDQMPMTQHTWLSNGDGDLLLKGLSEPPFKLSLNLEGYATLHQDVQHIHDHTLVMTKGFTVTIQLLGENVANRVVSYRLEGASPLMNMFVVGQGLKSDSFGQIKLENLTSGRYILTLGPTASGQDGIESLPFELFEGLDVIEVALP
jgi:protocatechuate 3,4-dioxygenase beta subunit